MGAGRFKRVLNPSHISGQFFAGTAQTRVRPAQVDHPTNSHGQRHDEAGSARTIEKAAARDRPGGLRQEKLRTEISAIAPLPRAQSPATSSIADGTSIRLSPFAAVDSEQSTEARRAT